MTQRQRRKRGQIYLLKWIIDIRDSFSKMPMCDGIKKINLSPLFLYDAANRLSSITNGGGRTYSYQYDSIGRRTKLSMPNGTYTTYAYDNSGRLTNLTHKTSAGAIIDSFSYTHDKIGNRLTKTEPVRSAAYTYDKTYRLITAVNSKTVSGSNPFIPQDEAYTYDPAGNRLTSAPNRSYSYNQSNQLTNYKGKAYIYDKNGNLTIKTDEDYDLDTEIEGWTYTYDYENRLIKVVKNEQNETKAITFKYDPFGRRMEKKVESIDKGVAETSIQTYVYDNEDIIFKYITKTSNGATTTETKKYLHGPGIDEHLSLTNDTGTYYYHADGLGSITALTDGSGNVVQTYEYDSFGKVHDNMNAIKQPYTFTGREWDKEIGLYYYRARYYDAETGRFVSFDPILRGFSHVEEVGCRESITSFPLEQPQKLHPYAYVENNPLNLTDASGLCPKVPDITFVQTAIRTGQTPVQITYLISCTLVKSEKVKIGSKCFEKCSYNCKQSWSWVAPESGKTFGGKTTFPKQYEFERDANECCE